MVTAPSETMPVFWQIKSKFFLYRFVSYFSFLLIPILIPKALALPLWTRSLLMCFYMLFMASQWFLLGKEIDHIIRIYFKVNSSIDRIVYRINLGMFFIVIYFNSLNLMTGKWIYNSFWMTWVILGLFYSWPTRGRIIQESVTSHFSEIKYLDRFEKTLLVLILIMLIVSLPQFPNAYSLGELKTYYDPSSKISPLFWNFLTVNYYPFLKFPELLNLAWGMHFYFMGMGLYLLCFYALSRAFFSRRTSILGVFSLLSCWSLSKILIKSPEAPVSSAFFLLWTWAIIWAIKSSTYKSGLLLGLVAFWGCIIHQTLAFVYVIQVILLLYFLKDKTVWFKKNLFEYTMMGFFMIIITLVLSGSFYTEIFSFSYPPSFSLDFLYFRKAFFTLAPVGMVVFITKLIPSIYQRLSPLKTHKNMVQQLFACLLVSYLLFLLLDPATGESLSFLWVVAFMSLVPLELIFQSMRSFPSSRNIIYPIYILICLLDSRFEERVKVFLQIFE